MKSTEFFVAVYLPEDEPDPDPPPSQRIWNRIFIALGCVILVTIGTIFTHQLRHDRSDTQLVSHRSATPASTSLPSRSSIYDVSLSAGEDRLYLRNYRGEIRELTLSGVAPSPAAHNLFPDRICERLKTSPDRRFMLASFVNDAVLLIDLTDNSAAADKLLTLELTEAVKSISFSQDSRFCALGTTSGRVLVWDIATHKSIASLTKSGTEICSVCLNHLDEVYLSCGAHIERWKIQPHLNPRLKFDFRLKNNSSVREMVLIDDDELLLAGHFSGMLANWNLSQNQLAWKIQNSYTPSQTLALTPDCQHVAYASIGDELTLYHIETGKRDGAFSAKEMGYVTGAAFSNSGEILYTSSTDGLIRIWSVPDRTQIGTLDPEIHSELVSL